MKLSFQSHSGQSSIPKFQIIARGKTPFCLPPFPSGLVWLWSGEFVAQSEDVVNKESRKGVIALTLVLMT